MAINRTRSFVSPSVKGQLRAGRPGDDGAHTLCEDKQRTNSTVRERTRTVAASCAERQAASRIRKEKTQVSPQ